MVVDSTITRHPFPQKRGKKTPKIPTCCSYGPRTRVAILSPSSPEGGVATGGGATSGKCDEEEEDLDRVAIPIPVRRVDSSPSHEEGEKNNVASDDDVDISRVATDVVVRVDTPSSSSSSSSCSSGRCDEKNFFHPPPPTAVERAFAVERIVAGSRGGKKVSVEEDPCCAAAAAVSRAAAAARKSSRSCRDSSGSGRSRSRRNLCLSEPDLSRCHGDVREKNWHHVELSLKVREKKRPEQEGRKSCDKAGPKGAKGLVKASDARKNRRVFSFF